MDDWTPCPGGRTADFDAERMVGVCPGCRIVVHTLFPHGTIPPHLFNPATGTVTFTPRIPPSHESDETGRQGSE